MTFYNNQITTIVAMNNMRRTSGGGLPPENDEPSMSKKHKIIILMIGIILIVSSVFLEHTSSYTTETFRKVCVINKIATESTHKGNVYTHLNLVLKESSNNRIFDREVSPKLYTTKKINDCFNFKLSEMNIQQDRLQDFYLLVRIISFSAGVSLILVFILFML